MSSDTDPVLGVLGGSGGVGASSFAAVLAIVAASVEGAAGGGSVLVDLDVTGGGIDVLLGIEGVAGARWSGLQLDGGFLDPQTLRDGLPHAGGAAVLAADVPGLESGAVEQVLVCAGRVGPVVLDLPRSPCAERSAALQRCRLVVVLARADVPGLVAARAVAAAVAPAPVGVVVRAGEVPAEDAAELIGAPLLGELPALDTRWSGIDVDRPPRAMARLAEGLLAGVCPVQDDTARRGSELLVAGRGRW